MTPEERDEIAQKQLQAQQYIHQQLATCISMMMAVQQVLTEINEKLGMNDHPYAHPNLKVPTNKTTSQFLTDLENIHKEVNPIIDLTKILAERAQKQENTDGGV